MDKEVKQKQATRAGRFKSAGSRIIGSRGAAPANMVEFLNDQLGEGANPEERNGADVQMHKSTDNNQTTPTPSNDTTVRIHVHIEKPIADRLFETVYRRKRDRATGDAPVTQRIIIEEALIEFFNKNEL